MFAPLFVVVTGCSSQKPEAVSGLATHMPNIPPKPDGIVKVNSHSIPHDSASMTNCSVSRLPFPDHSLMILPSGAGCAPTVASTLA